MRSTDLRGTVQVEAALTHFVVFDGAMEALVRLGTRQHHLLQNQNESSRGRDDCRPYLLPYLGSDRS